MDTNCLTKKIGRPIGFLGDNIFYEDKGCKYAKKLKYNGTCLPSKDYQMVVLLPIFAWKMFTIINKRNTGTTRLEGIVLRARLSYTNISNITGLKISTIENVIRNNNTEKYKNNLLYSSV